MQKKIKPNATGLVWLIVLAVIAAMSLNQRMQTNRFYGIAEPKETDVNSEHAVEIRGIRVVSGQPISKGDTLAILYRQDLSLKINDIAHQLEQFRAAGLLNVEELRSKAGQLKAEKDQKIGAITSQILQLKAQISINKALTADLKSVDTAGIVLSADNPQLIRLRSLEDELQLAARPFDIQIAQFEAAAASPKSADKILIEKLQRDLALLEEQKKDLIIVSPIDGSVGAVNHREGEQISAFTTILSIHSSAPLYIKCYIHENVSSRVAMGQKAIATSLTNSNKTVAGTVAGIGTRIVEYPARLRKRPDIQIWGREVIIKIPEQNPFLLGEKVIVSVR